MVPMIALFALALLVGGMVFFAAVTAPLVFTRLPPDQAGRFIRAVFPFYYLYVLVAAAIAALALAPLAAGPAAALAVVAGTTVWLRQGLMPRINRLSDAAQAGDAAAGQGFARAHRLSVIVNFAQLAAAGWALAGFA
jgi:hypothetical protein